MYCLIVNRLFYYTTTAEYNPVLIKKEGVNWQIVDVLNLCFYITY